MHEFKKFGKKLFTMSVVGMTMVWSVGLSAFVPAGVAAASCPELVAGDLFKVPTIKSNPATTAVYLLTSDMKRLYFPTSLVFESWYGSFANVQVKEIPSSCLDAYDLAGGVNFRPGSRLLKTPLSPTIWAVAPGNMKVKVTDGSVLTATYGAGWEKMVSDWSDQWFANLSSASGELTKLHDGQLVKKANDATVYYVWNGMLKKVDGTLPAHLSKDVRTVSEATFSAVSMDSTTVTPATVSANPSQRSGSTVTTPATGGALSVSLSADTPVQPAGGLADGTAFNKMLKVSLRAASKDVKVTGLTITRNGLINNTYVTGVSVWNSAGYRKGNVMTSFNSSNQVTVGFGSDPILVAAGSTEVVTVAFNLSSDAGSGSVGASIADKAHIMTDASSVEGSFPVAGNIMSVVDGGNSLSSFTVTSTAVGGNSASGDAANVSVGDVKEIGKFRFAETSGRNNLAVNGIVFFLEGNARDKDFTNFEVLGQDNTVLGKTEYAGNRYVTVKFTSPYIVPMSQNRIVTLRAKVSDGSGNYLRAKIQNDFDVMVEDNALHYQLLPSSFVATGAADGYFKVREGSLTLSKSQASKSGNVSAGSTDVELASFDVTAVGEDLEIQKIGVGITTSGPTMALTGNLRLVADNGDTLAQFAASSASDALYAGGSQRNLSQYWTIPSGQTKKLYVRGDINSNATSTGYLVSVGNFYARRVSSQTYAENLPSSSNVGTSGNTVTVQASNLTVSKDTSVGSGTVSAGRTGVVLAQFVVQAGSAEGVRLTNVSVSSTGDALIVNGGVKNLKLMMGTSTASLTQVGATISAPATSSNAFSIDNTTVGSVPANALKVVQIVGDVSSAVSSGSYVWGLSSFTYIGLSTNNPQTGDPVLGQTMTVGAANVIISAINDTTTVSKLYTPSTAPVQLGKWKVEAQNEDVTLNKITFLVSRPDGSTKTEASEFGTLSLYDADAMSASLDESPYASGNVRFEKSNMLTIKANTTKYLVLMGQITGSGVMSPATTSAFFIAPTSTTNFEMLRSSGGTVENTMLDFGASGQTYNATHATTTFYLFHNAAPKIVSETLANGTALSKLTQSQIFRFTVTNQGDRPMKMSTTTINVQVSGLLASGATSGTGTIYGFELHDAEGAGFNSQTLATSSLANNTNSSGGVTGSACIAGGIGATASDATGACANSVTSSLNLVFGVDSDSQSLFEDIQIAPGASRTFVLTANTNNIAAGRTSYPSTVTVSASLAGSRGYVSGNATHEANWADGVIQYFYTPVNGSINTTAYSASDSYPVNGPSLSLAI